MVVLFFLSDDYLRNDYLSEVLSLARVCIILALVRSLVTIFQLILREFVFVFS